MITGILPVDKPLGWTSHDVVARVRRTGGQRQVGHAGTLDPLASGVLLLVLGRATRLSSYLMAAPKVYCADVVLGVTTLTDDAEGAMQTQADISHLSRSDLERCLERFVGDISQVPPAYAALKRGGEKLYVLARQGVEVTPEPRHVMVYSIDMQDWRPPHLRMRIRCGSGTYIRSLARDIGATLGVGGYLHALRRTASGTFALADSHAIDALQSLDAVRRALQPPDRAVLSWPAAILGPSEVRAVCMGQSIRIAGPAEGQVRLYDLSGNLVALGQATGGRVRPFHVLAGG